MKFTVRLAQPQDEPFLWRMIYEATHLEEAGVSFAEARCNPALARYVDHWGQAHDVGYIAMAADTGQRLAAAWFRLLRGADKGFGHVSDEIPELAIATLPAFRGQGAGTALMAALIRHAQGTYPGLSLNVRATNPAVRLYERFGFQRLPGSEWVNSIGVHAFLMVLRFP